MSKILLVEDEVHARLSMSIVLRKAGYQVAEAPSGYKALEFFAPNTVDEYPDLLVLDLQLPEMSGLEIIDSMRQNNITTPILVVTGIWNRKIKNELTARSCFQYLEKPFSPDEFIKKVKAVLVKEQSQEEKH